MNFEILKNFFLKIDFFQNFALISAFFRENTENNRFNRKIGSKQELKSRKARVYPISFVEKQPFLKILSDFELFF